MASASPLPFGQTSGLTSSQGKHGYDSKLWPSGKTMNFGSDGLYMYTVLFPPLGNQILWVRKRHR